MPDDRGRREQADVLLQPYEADTFNGAFATTSIGKCVDFNLLHRPGWQGRIAPVTQPGLMACAPGAFTGIFARVNGLTVAGAGKDGGRFSETLHTGDFLMLELDAGEQGALTLTAPAGQQASVLCVVAEALRPGMAGGASRPPAP